MLWYKSKQCDSLDAFISQSWSAPGWQKYLALLIYFYSLPAVIAGLAALVVLSCLDGLGYMPTMKFGKDSWIGSEFCPWGVVPIATALGAMFLAPMIPGLRDRMVFFDAVCINQVDDELMTEGIYSLGGFVAKSKELLILWSHSYFKRAWCVLELAVFAALNPDRDVRFCPLFVTTTLFVGYIASSVCFNLYLVADYLSVNSDYAILSILLRMLVCLPIPAFAHKLRLHFLEMKELTSQLAQFSLDLAQCRLERDLRFIQENVEALYGTKDCFDKYVRENLRSQLLASKHHFEFQYVHFVIISFPFNINVFPQVISLLKQGRSLSKLLSAIALFAAVILFFSPALAKLFFVLCRLGAKQHNRKVVNLFVDIGITLLFFVSVVCSSMLITVIERSFDLGVLFCFGLGVIVASLAFGARFYDFCCAQRDSAQASTSQNTATV